MIEALKYEFCYKTKFEKSYRTMTLVGQYDLENKEIVQNFSGNYKLPEKWNIGLIVGNSGSGKSSILKKCFGEPIKLQWDNRALIENFASSLTMEEITNALGNVGFNTIPYWLKPFSVLSNGEKTRVEMARMALEQKFVVYDEFTSMVDRDVAKSMANSVNKLFHKLNKQLVVATCHKDLLQWLKPDWVLDTDENVFFYPHKIMLNDKSLKLKNHIKNDGNIIANIII